MRKFSLAFAVALCCTAPTSSQAVVGGSDVPAGQFTNVAEIQFGGIYNCTGTLIAPRWVMTAGHCGSLTGIAVATPISFPAAAIDVRLGSNQRGEGRLHPVAEVIVPPGYLATRGWDLSLLRLAAPADGIPSTKVAAPSESSIWAAGVKQTIAGWGLTSDGGDAPDVMQYAEVPVTTDEYCEDAYGGERIGLAVRDGFQPATMVCAGYPEGGIDTCQGDSGGPMFGKLGDGTLRLTGATSWGAGCAEPGSPGVYARVAGDTIRTWLASVVPEALAG